MKAAGATLLHIHLHTFWKAAASLVLPFLRRVTSASIHGRNSGYAAFDVFMCGDAEPRKALGVFKAAFNPGRIVIGEHKRGVL